MVSLKAAEDGDGLIMRLYESSGERGKVKISTELNIANVVECNLMEEDESRIDFKNGELYIDIKPYEIKTLRLRKS